MVSSFSSPVEKSGHLRSTRTLARNKTGSYVSFVFCNGCHFWSFFPLQIKNVTHGFDKNPICMKYHVPMLSLHLCLPLLCLLGWGAGRSVRISQGVSPNLSFQIKAWQQSPWREEKKKTKNKNKHNRRRHYYRKEGERKEKKKKTH